MPARGLGKGKTLATLVGIGLLLLSFDAASGGPLAGFGADAAAWLHDIGYWIMIVAAALSVVSGWEYVSDALPVITGRGRPPT
jgi:hypothetical protein